ncbi:MAG: YfhO family protein, partial [Lachnospiraceae bacterium]|nr:YfhO family protein [Lachnospiraceae bacterium]
MEQDKIRHPLIKVFFTSFVLFLISLLPVLIASKGVFLWIGDYNDQTIIFIERVHRVLHSKQGIPVYDWCTFLGMDFLSAYGEHVVSPFDWFLYILPYKAVPYAHSVLLAIKTGLASVTAYIYCRQYVKKDRSAFICGLLYAFSGFQLFNLVYQFSDRYLLFPLLLYSFDQLVINKKPLCFALLLGLNNLMSFYFCWIICVNIAIYYIVRTVTGSFPRLDIKLFLRLAAEVLLGLGSGMVSMLPCMLVLIGNN